MKHPPMRPPGQAARRRLATLCGFVLILAGLRAGAAHAGQDPEITIRDIPSAWITMHTAPLFVDVVANRPGRIRVEATGISGYGENMAKTVSLPERSVSRIELPLPAGGYSRVRGVAGAVEETSILRWDRPGHSVVTGEGGKLVCLNGFMLREILAAAGSATREVFADTLSIEELPSMWQSYAGFIGTLVIDASEARTLKPAQREALARWVTWLGGRVWVIGEGAERSAELLVPAVPPRPPERRGGVAAYARTAGTVYAQNRPDAAELLEQLPASPQRDLFSRYYRGEYLSSQSRQAWDSRKSPAWLVEGLGALPVGILIAALAFLGLLLGPVNLWYVRRRRNALLFFITTPLLAAVGTALIFAAILIGEGLRGRYRQAAILLRADSGDDALVVDFKGVRSGYFPPTLGFREDALVLPVGRYNYERILLTDRTDGVSLSGEWLMPRFPTSFLRAEPVVSRLNIEANEENGEWRAVNGLGFTARNLVVRLPGGGIGWAENVRPGDTVRLARENSDARMKRLLADLAPFGLTGDVLPDIAIAAECDGIPYLDDGGLDAVKVEGLYYYLAAGVRPEGDADGR